MVSIVANLTGAVDYDPWLDVNDDGYGGIDDIVTTAEHFGASGDTTKNVNVTNWLLPIPITVHYYTWELSWADNLPIIEDAPPIFVGEYSQMSVLLKFDNVSVEYGNVIWTVDIQWMDVDNTYDANWPYRLSSTLGRKYSSGFAAQIMTDSYAIEAPYIQLSPAVLNTWPRNYNGNASISIYLRLSHGQLTSSEGRKTASWSVSEHIGSSGFEHFDFYFANLQRSAIGLFSSMVLHVSTNVSCNIYLDDEHNEGLDSFVKSSGWTRKSYEMTLPFLRIRVQSVSFEPCHVIIKITLLY
jgi:hypothetical protein